MTVRVARWSAGHPWRAIGLWIVFVVACTVLGGALGTNKATDLDQAARDAGTAGRVAHAHGVSPPAVENVVITSRSGALPRAEAQKAATEVAAALRTMPQVAKVDAAVPSKDGTALMVPVTMSGDPLTAKDRVQPLRDRTANVQKEHPGLRVEQTGAASINKGLSELIAKDLVRADGIGFPVTLLILVVAFGALIAAGVPILLAITAILGATGLTALVSHLVPMYDTASSMTMLMGMAVGVDYSLFYLRREREERLRGARHRDAIEIAAATSGHAVVVSGVAVIVAMAGLFLTQNIIFTSLATAAIVVVAVAMLGSITVLPAILAKLGPRVDKPRVPVLWRLTATRENPRLWRALLRPALGHPVITLVLAVAALAALALPALGMNLRPTTADQLPRAIPALQTYDRLVAAYPSQSTEHQIVVRSAPGEAQQVRAALTDLAKRTSGDRLFVARGPRPDIRSSADGRVQMLTLSTPYGMNSGQARDAVKELRDDLVPATVGKVAGAENWVGGDAAASVDFGKQISERLPLVVAFVLGLTFVMMTLMFRSVVVALTAILVNLLSVGASFGALVLIFQHTWLEKPLGFHSTGAIVAWIPLFLFAVLFGLSMDYHVFLVSRIREAAQAGMPTRRAVAEGITGSAGTVTSAAVIMISVFAIFGALRLMDMKEMGVGLAVAVLIDAVVIRIVVLPAAMVLLGRANWWPGRLSRKAPARGERISQRVPVG
ncbi:MMPL family transporter [Actinomadura rupiterrae]|uniref:MMPL family transporter n=1 Tax=Actinomadura rupiterrae TaxID=559627 RepID=UPI0020A3833A|nr:MMPL family transporter [Actinomadura rupiterrae]MCP2341818.1 RND superfamily putative drug exporter [Actinomadura rupiterrae]